MADPHLRRQIKDARHQITWNEVCRGWPFLSYSNWPSKAVPMPCAVPPRTWPSTVIGLTAIVHRHIIQKDDLTCLRIHLDHRRMAHMTRGLNRSTQHFIVEGKIDYMPISQRFRSGMRAAEKMSLWDSWLRGSCRKRLGERLASRHRYLLPAGPECCVDRLNRHP